MKTFRFVLLLFLVLSISNTAWAQNQTVKGRVMDSKLKDMIIISISKSKRLKTLQRINEVAEESNQLKDAFIANMTHEIRKFQLHY